MMEDHDFISFDHCIKCWETYQVWTESRVCPEGGGGFMLAIDVLTKTLNRIMLVQTSDHEYGCMVYTLWDTSESCVLDKWRIHDHDDMLRMQRDLNQIYHGGK